VIQHTTHDQTKQDLEDSAQDDRRPPNGNGWKQNSFRNSQHESTPYQHVAQIDGQGSTLPTQSAPSSGQLQIELQNQSTSSNVFAYITGQAINNGGALFLLGFDGKTPYYPTSPSSTGSALQQNVSIKLGPPGTSIDCTIPYLAGGRIWFSIDKPLVFLLNPGPGLVEPSIYNQSDPNVSTSFGFAEFTYNNAQLFANISYVDFVGLPIALTLVDTDRHTHSVSGLPSNGLQIIADGLRKQTARDGQNWSSLIVNSLSGQLLRILSPNSGILLNPSWFQGYFATYVSQVYGKYASQALTINTQAQWGNVQGISNGGGINFGSGGNFVQPSTADIFSCASGPFATGSNAEANTIIPRLAAAFNRSTLLLSATQPVSAQDLESIDECHADNLVIQDGVTPKQYYQNSIANVSA